MELLKALESVRCPVLDRLMQAITFLGEETIFMVLALSFLWCVDKWKGYYLLSASFLGTILSQALKLICHIPRPWVRDPSFSVVESAKAGATGYSFPSGHTQGAACSYGGIARSTKRPWLRWCMGSLILLVGFSRMYLGAHDLADVGVGLGLGLGVVLLLFPVFQRAREDRRVLYGFLAGMLLLNLGYLAYVRFGSFPADAYQTDGNTKVSNHLSALQNAWSLLGALLGTILSLLADRKICYSEKAPLPGQICKLVLGLALLVALRAGLKSLFAMISQGAYWNGLRYFCMVAFAGAVWPLSFPFWASLGGRRKDAGEK